jgi:type IV secretory pathway TraG/TraD family ATPase VirD4
MRVLAVLSVLVCSLAGFWSSTEYVAAKFDYAPELGPPWAAVGELRVFALWDWVLWDGHYGSVAPTVFRRASHMTALAALAGTLVAALAALRRKPSGPSHAHGSSRWATTSEIMKSGLLKEGGVVLCQTSDAAFRTAVDAAGNTKTVSTRLGKLVCQPKRATSAAQLRSSASPSPP